LAVNDLFIGGLAGQELRTSFDEQTLYLPKGLKRESSKSKKVGSAVCTVETL
jgi:hypothetical protein